jgi:hypothetical protein
MGTGS